MFELAKKWDKGYDAVRSIIMNAASKCICSGGFAQTSLQEIASEAGMSKGTLYYYYPSKELLLHDMAQEHLLTLTNRLFAWISQLNKNMRDEDALTTLLDIIFPNDDNHGFARMHTVLLHEIAVGNRAIREQFELRRREWRMMIEVGAIKALGTRETQNNLPDLFFTMINGCAADRMMSCIRV